MLLINNYATSNWYNMWKQKFFQGLKEIKFQTLLLDSYAEKTLAFGNLDSKAAWQRRGGENWMPFPFLGKWPICSSTSTAKTNLRSKPPNKSQSKPPNKSKPQVVKKSLKPNSFDQQLWELHYKLNRYNMWKNTILSRSQRSNSTLCYWIHTQRKDWRVWKSGEQNCMTEERWKNWMLFPFLGNWPIVHPHPLPNQISEANHQTNHKANHQTKANEKSSQKTINHPSKRGLK